MFLGCSFLGNLISKNALPPSQSFSSIKLLGNGIFDELHVRNTVIDESALLALNTEEKFGDNSIILAHMSGMLGGGDYNGLDTPIYKYLVYKRKAGDVQYQLFAEIYQESGVSTVYDYACRNYQEYEYWVLPVGEDETVGSGTTQVVKLNFWGWYLSDLTNENLFKFDLNVESSTIQNVLNISVQNNPTRFPKVIQSKQNYLQSSFSTIPYNLDGSSYVFDYAVLEEIRMFLLDGEEKILRNTSGEGFKCRIINASIQHMDSVQNEKNGSPFLLNFEFVQTGILL